MREGEQMARMGEYAASRRPRNVLVALGLGSCIGLALVDPRTRVAGLAHIVLPAGAAAEDDAPAKYAPSAVPFLLDRMVGLGARRSRLQAVVVGGASMFDSSPGMEIGQRNEVAVLEELERARIPLVASATGGNRGRTIRVYVGESRVTARIAGGTEEHLFGEAPVGVLA